MEQDQATLNPVKRVSSIAAAGIPVYLIHGDSDKLVPLQPNSGEYMRAYEKAGKSDLITLEVLEGQGHNAFRGFFQSSQLVDFLIRSAKSG